MRSPTKFLLAVAVVLLALSSQALRAADEKAPEATKALEATVVKVEGNMITLTFKGDTQKHTHDVAKDAKITLDGKAAKLEALKEGFPVKVTMDAKFVITKIDAQSKGK